MLVCVAQLQTAGDEIYDRPVYFVNNAGKGISIHSMHDHNADVHARQKSGQKPNPADVVYLMYALITCQSWWEVSSFVGNYDQLKSGMSVRHVYIYLYQQHACVWWCVCTQECFRFLTARGKWWKVVAHISAALCSMRATSLPSALDDAEAESQLEVCI